MFRFASAARQAARASSRRAYSTAAPAPKASDLPWAIGSLAVFVPTVFYLTSPKEDAHVHGHHTANAKPAQPKVEASASAHAVPEKVEQADKPAPKEEKKEEEVAEEKETEKEETATDAPAAKKEKVDGPKDVAKAAEASQNTNDKEVEESKEEKKDDEEEKKEDN